MKIFNWIFSSFFRTFGRFLFYILIGLIAMLFISGKVNAKTYLAENNGSLWKDQWTNKTLPGFLIDTTISQNLNGFEFNLELTDTTAFYNFIEAGNYLFDFTIIADNLDMSRMNNCRSWSSDFRFYDQTTGDLVGAKASISSTCVNTFYTKVNGKNALKLMFRFNITNTQSYDYRTRELKFIIYQGAYPIVSSDGTKTFQVGIGNIQDYDSAIVDAFNNEANSNIQINQNQTIIDQNTQTNNKLDETNDKLNDLNSNLTSTEGANLDALRNSAGWLPAGPVDSILNLPLSLLNNLTTNLNKSCQPVILPIPYVNKDLTLPCVNTLYDDMGISGWVTTIGVIASAFIMLSYLLKLYRWVDDTLSFRENNQIDNWGGI